MNFWRKMFDTYKATKNDELDGLSPEEKQLHLHFSQVCDEMPAAWTICKVIAVHDLSRPIVFDVFFAISNALYITRAIEHLEKKCIIRSVVKLTDHGLITGGWFNLVNPVYGKIIMKRITNEEYHNGVFEALGAIDKFIQFRQFQETNLILSPYSTALPQAIHVWKEALKYEYDDLIEKFWNVPLDIMKYMANVKPITEEQYAPIRQLAKETKPAFDRLFPDPAPWYSRFSLIWLLYDWDEFWEAVGDDRKRFAKKKERLNFYLNYKF